MDRLQESELRRMGRTALQKAANAGAGKQSPGIARRPMLVTEVNSDGTLDLNMGSTDSQKILPGIRMTSACYGVKVGDVVVVETIDHKSFATGIVAKSSKDPNDNGPYITVASGPYAKGSLAMASISVVVNFMGNDYCAIPSMQQALGYAFNAATDFVGVMNADWGANQTRLYGALYDNGSLYAKAPSASYNACRLNILYVHKL